MDALSLTLDGGHIVALVQVTMLIKLRRQLSFSIDQFLYGSIVPGFADLCSRPTCYQIHYVSFVMLPPSRMHLFNL